MEQQPQFNIDFTQTTPIKCDECGNEHFVEVSMLRRLPAILSPTGQTAIIPVPVFACSVCHHVNEEFLPNDSL